MRELDAEFYVDRQMIREAVAAREMFNVIHKPTMIKADVYVVVGPTEELSRRVGVQQGGQEVPFSSREDVIIAKLRWYRLSGERSDRQWQDVIGVLREQDAWLDNSLMDVSAQTQGLQDLLERARQEASE